MADQPGRCVRAGPRQKPLGQLAPATYYAPMKPHSRRGRRWRRFVHKYGVYIFVAVVVLIVMAVVAFLTYALTSIKWRGRY